MSPNLHRVFTPASHTRRRRLPAPGHPIWVRSAGLVGGVVSAIALSGAAVPAQADTPHHPPAPPGAAASGAPAGTVATAAPALAGAVPLSTAVTTAQAAQALELSAMDLSLAAAKEQAAAQAAAQAAEAAKAARAAATRQAAAQAARERAAAAVQAASRTAQRVPLAPVTASGSVARLISFLKAQVGKPYVFGATGPSSYDCSGLTQAAFAGIGVSLPRTSQEQSTVGTPVAISALQPGDLVFWGGQGSAYHVGVYIGGGEYLDAANPSTGIGTHPLSYSMPDFATRVL